MTVVRKVTKCDTELGQCQTFDLTHHNVTRIILVTLDLKECSFFLCSFGYISETVKEEPGDWAC